MIDYDKVKEHYQSYKDIANAFPQVKAKWEDEFPLIEPLPGDVLTGKVSDYVLDSQWMRTFQKDMAANFGIRFKNDLRLMSNDLFIFAGDRWHYDTMYYVHAQVLMLCMYQANTKFPGHKWVMGDAGGNWSTHVYHNSYTVFDLNYPTFEHSNTHYYRDEFPREKLWKEEHYPYRTLIPGLVDIPKLYYFFSLLKKCFPSSNIMVNQGMHNVLTSFGGEAVTTYGDDRPEYNHDKHAHCYLGRDINFGADIGE